MSKAEILVPGLGLALYNICYKSLINSWKKRLVELGENSEEGILLLDDKLKIHYFNLKAAEICRILIGRKNENRLDRENTDFPVPSCIIRDCVNLINMLRMTNQPIVWPKERIIFDDYGHQFRIECSIIWKSDQLNAIRPYFMVSLIDLKNENNTTNKFNLTKRESDVLYCMVRGLSYNEIAEKLFISKLTVHTHVKNIYRKLGIKNKIELIRNIQSPTWVL